jgi:hypothetical protein
MSSSPVINGCRHPSLPAVVHDGLQAMLKLYRKELQDSSEPPYGSGINQSPTSGHEHRE